MNLVEYQAKLELMIENRDSELRTRLETLANSSPEHQRAWEDFLIIEQTLPAWKDSVPDVDLVEAVMSQLEYPDETIPSASTINHSPSQERHFNSTKGRLLGGLLLAAAVLIAVSLKFSGNTAEVDSSNPAIATSKESPAIHAPDAPAAAPQHSINQLLRNAGTASWGLAQSTAGTMTEAVSLVPVARSTQASNSLVPEESDWVDDINHEMKPLKDQISHAWNFILLSVPDESTRI